MPKLVTIDQDFLTLEQTIAKIEAGEFLIVAADEDFLTQLPNGNWLGGTIPYFIAENGGVENFEKAFVHTVNGTNQISMKIYDEKSISRIATDGPDSGQGFTILMLPAGSAVHSEYAKSAPQFPEMFSSPIIGWVTGTHLGDIGQKDAKTVYGLGSLKSTENAVAMHVSLPENQYANIEIINPFEQSDGDVITFDTATFDVDKCKVNGEEVSFAKYLVDNGISTTAPLVANYNGTGVNVSIQEIDDTVKLYAPVFPGVEYSFANKIGDYVGSFEKLINSNQSCNKSQFSVNCILNYLQAELEGKKTGPLVGPITFGEVGYQLLNQTAVYMTIETV